MPSLVMAHCSRRASACIFICLLIVTWIQQMSQLLASTRFVWALARDNAFPFATLWRKLSPKSQMPRRATILLITVTIVITCFLCLSSTHITVFIWRSDSYLSLVSKLPDGDRFWNQGWFKADPSLWPSCADVLCHTSCTIPIQWQRCSLSRRAKLLDSAAMEPPACIVGPDHLADSNDLRGLSHWSKKSWATVS